MLLRSSRVPFSLPELEFLPTTRAYLSRTREIMKDSDLYRDGQWWPKQAIFRAEDSGSRSGYYRGTGSIMRIVNWRLSLVVYDISQSEALTTASGSHGQRIQQPDRGEEWRRKECHNLQS